jgi:hypothetical protein
MATYALCPNDARLTVICIETDGLMTSVMTRGITTTATDTFVSLYHWIDDGVAVQVGRGDKVGQFLTYEVS